MDRRRAIRRQHERAVVLDFLRWFESRRKVAFRIIREPDPDPPEAIIQSYRLTRWVEVVDAFWSREWARDQYSFATPGERHVPIRPGPYLGPDATFAHSFVEALSSKLAKESYLPTVREYGPGYLVVNIEYPLFDRRAYDAARELWWEGRPWRNNGYFREVFLRVQRAEGYAFKTWLV